MANPRKPAQLAEIMGATVVNPGRHSDRTMLAVGEVGAPYARMTDAQKVLWAEIAAEFPWLAISDRRQLRLLCKLEDEADRLGEAFPFNKQNMIRQIYNSFGGPAAGTDRGDNPTSGDDPTSEFFD